MKKLLTFAGAALALSNLTATAPAQAQVVFESAYAQPAEMIDGLSVGSRIGLNPHESAAPGLTAPRRVAAAGRGRSHPTH